ncbi:MAG: hypothetical protein ACR2PT_12605 [Endozoicomonas sp.]
MSELATNILDPVSEQFGELTLTYGFCSPSLARERKRLAKEQGIVPGIYPALDQHSGHELNRKGELICTRGGAACDFIVEGISSQVVAAWIVQNLPFDRLYYYAPDRPLHVSYNRQSRAAEVTMMTPKVNGRGYIPRTLTSERFLERYA